MLDIIMDSFVVTVFRMDDGTLIPFGQPPDTVGYETVWDDRVVVEIVPILLFNHHVVCDTNWDGGVRTITCDTVEIDTLSGANESCWIDTLFDITNSGFADNSDFNRIALQLADGSDAWTYRQTDILYDLYRNLPADTTREVNFIVWVQSRDPIDTTIHDPTPALRAVNSIDSAFE